MHSITTIGKIFALIALFISFYSGCHRHTYSPTGYFVGSCDASCHHYVLCRATQDNIDFTTAGSAEDTTADYSEELLNQCITECSATYEQDAQTLAEFQGLDCEDAVSFIEGDLGRPIGVAATEFPPYTLASRTFESNLASEDAFTDAENDNTSISIDDGNSEDSQNTVAGDASPSSLPSSSASIPRPASP